MYFCKHAILFSSLEDNGKEFSENTENNKSRKINNLKRRLKLRFDETRYVRGSPSQNTVSSLFKRSR
jgi:sensor histidine kinase YesM